MKSPLEDALSDPKFNTSTALLADPAVVEELYITAPLAVTLELDQVTSTKSVNAVGARGCWCDVC